MADATIDALGTERRVHVATVIAATARMAGTFLFRSFNFNLDGVVAGQPVISVEANEQGPQLVQILEAVLESSGIKIDEEKIKDDPNAENPPLLDFLQTQKKLEPAFAEIKNRHRLSLQEAAQSAAAACALLIQQTVETLDPNIAFGIAVFGFIEGTKTAPDPVTQ